MPVSGVSKPCEDLRPAIANACGKEGERAVRCLLSREPLAPSEEGKTIREPPMEVDDGIWEARRSCFSSNAGLIVDAGEVAVAKGLKVTSSNGSAER